MFKYDNELADVTLSGSLIQNRAAATGNARPPTVDSLNCIQKYTGYRDEDGR